MSRIWLLCILLVCVSQSLAMTNTIPVGPVSQGNNELDWMQTENWVHREGNVWMNVTNWGVLGNDSPASQDWLTDPVTGEWAPQCEFPAGSGTQYLFQSGLWIGAIIQEDGFEYPRVSTAMEGWIVNGGNEFWPGNEPDHGIVERSSIPDRVNEWGETIYHPDAIGHEEIIAVYSDTSRIDVTGRELRQPLDSLHVPLGVEVTQRSMVWSTSGFDQIIICFFTIRNIGDNLLKNLYLGIYVDADVGNITEDRWYDDDLEGFLESFHDQEVDIAFIADNDGRPSYMGTGNDFTAPGVIGVKILHSPVEQTNTSFNWWVSNVNHDLDFGPAWVDDGSPGEWTAELGTPESDERKYFLMSNREHDFDQVYVNDPDYIQNHPQEIRDADGEVVEVHEWRIADPANADDIGNGFDARFLLSFGPIGNVQHDEGGHIFTELTPGDSAIVHIAYVLGDSLHDRNNPQPDNIIIDPSLYDFTDLVRNAQKAQFLYDNDFQFDLPYAPTNFHIENSTDDEVVLEWDRFSEINVDEIQVFRRTNMDAPLPVPLAQLPGSDTQFIDNDVEPGEFYYYSARSIKADTLVSKMTDVLLVSPGRPDAPSYIRTASSLNSEVYLYWDENREEDLDHYTIYRSEQDTFEFQLLGTSETPEYWDHELENGRAYHYFITANDHGGFESLPSDTVSATPMGFTQELLLIHLTDSPITWPEDSVDAFYQEVFDNSGVNWASIRLSSNEITDQLQMTALSDYRVVWLMLDYLYSAPFDPVSDEIDIFRDYIALGGRLIISGLNLSRRLTGIREGWRIATSTFVDDCLGLDSLYQPEFIFPNIEGDFLQAVPEDDSYPLLQVDSTRISFAGIFDGSTMGGIGIVVPDEDTDVLYRYGAVEPDTSYSHGGAIATRHIGPNYVTMLLTFPLYAMGTAEEASQLVESIWEDISIETAVGDQQTGPAVIHICRLFQPFPNPFNSEISISFELDRQRRVSLELFNLLGQSVATITDKQMSAGYHKVTLDGQTLSSGMYIVVMRAESYQEARKVLLIR